MFDNRLQPLVARLLDPGARRLAAAGVRADQITVAGFAIGLAALPALAAGWFVAALALIMLNRIADGLDGAVARRAGPTDRGAFLDIALDFVFYALVPLGMALHDPSENALAAAVLIAAFVGTGSSFLAFAAVAGRREKKGRVPGKGIAYLGGLTEGAETIVFLVLICLFPRAFPALAYGFAVLCMLTTLARWREGWVQFGSPPQPRE